MADPGFWGDPKAAQKVLQRRKRIEADLDLLKRLRGQEDDAKVLADWLEAGEDVAADFGVALDALEATLEAAEFQKMLGGEHDRSNAILTINAGAGGTDSQDWAEMLLRMYLRWCDRRGFKRDITDTQAGEEAGIKSATVMVQGEYAFGYLAAEAGVHRLVRISPFDSNARRQTSFASVFAWPEIDETIEIEVLDKDLRIDTYRSSGAGGQHVNVTDSAVRLTHLPSGIVVACQNERSQIRNREVGMKILKARQTGECSAHVPALVRPPRLQARHHRHPGGRGGGDQERHRDGAGRVRLRLPGGGGRGAPPRAHQPLRLERAAPDLLRLRLRLARDRRDDRDRGPGQGPADRHLPLQRAGGQHVNVTDSAVRITHLPTGIAVACQNERSQIRNRELGMKILKARLYELELQKRREKLDVVEAGKKDIAFGSQIRSYVLHPYRMVKDHRTKHETGNPDRVLDGDLDDFVKATLVAKAKGTLGQATAAEE